MGRVCVILALWLADLAFATELVDAIDASCVENEMDTAPLLQVASQSDIWTQLGLVVSGSMNWLGSQEKHAASRLKSLANADHGIHQFAHDNASEKASLVTAVVVAEKDVSRDQGRKANGSRASSPLADSVDTAHVALPQKESAHIDTRANESVEHGQAIASKTAVQGKLFESLAILLMAAMVLSLMMIGLCVALTLGRTQIDEEKRSMKVPFRESSGLRASKQEETPTSLSPPVGVSPSNMSISMLPSSATPSREAPLPQPSALWKLNSEFETRLPTTFANGWSAGDLADLSNWRRRQFVVTNTKLGVRLEYFSGKSQGNREVACTCSDIKRVAAIPPIVMEPLEPAAQAQAIQKIQKYEMDVSGRVDDCTLPQRMYAFIVPYEDVIPSQKVFGTDDRTTLMMWLSLIKCEIPDIMPRPSAVASVQTENETPQHRRNRNRKMTGSRS